jgi:hypothetical protein
MDYNKILPALQQSLASRRMSVIVGSGFSKNVSVLFPDWMQLIADLVYELYENEIQQVINSITDTQRQSDARCEEIKKIIKKKGYLKVVSEYIERKGYEEAIVSYIEERTPVILGYDDQYYLLENEKRVLISPNQLKLHRFLLGLPWNNVYTTNYDPLLEASVDVTIHATKLKENGDLKKKINDLGARITPLEQEVEQLSNERDKLNVELRYTDENGSTGEDDPGVTEREKQRMEIFGKIFRASMDLNTLKAEQREIQKEVYRNENILNQSYTVVKGGPELSLKKNKNIIKLHGSLRSEKERKNNKYGFDGDARKQYVISVEHYEQYPERHEAFTQLMRISLLQESFCLIGFSGDDPNFLGWVRWVRDLLYRAPENNDQYEYKIYLIDVSEAATLPDRLLFFENHRIVRIPLMASENIEFLERETGSKLDVKNRIGSALWLLLRFLDNHEQIVLPVIPKDSTLPAKWRRAWDQLFDRQDATKLEADKINQVLNIVRSLSKEVTGVDLNHWDTFSQHRFLDNLRNINFQIPRIRQEEVDELVSEAVLTLMLPAPALLDRSTLERFHTKLGRILERDMVIADPFCAEEIHDSYAHILRLAYSFRYKELQEAVISWDAPIQKLHLKAGFLAWFDPVRAIQILEDQLNSYELSEQDRMFSFELLLFIMEGNALPSEMPGRQINRIREKIKQYKNAGYTSLFSRLESLVESVGDKKEKLTPYGENRFSVSHSILMDSSSKAKQALQILVLLADYGFSAAFRYRAIINAEEYYRVIKVGVAYAPFPYIFYALQYSNEKVIRRIGQDLAINISIREQLPLILKTLLSSYDDMPELRQSSLLVMVAELFIAVNPSLWEDAFFEIWEKLAKENKLFNRYPDASQSFVKSGIRFIEKPEILFGVIIDLLDLLHSHAAGVISYLFSLNRSYVFGASFREQVPEKLILIINKLIDQIPSRTEDVIFVLGNLNKILTEDMLVSIGERLALCDFSGFESDRVFRIILFFSRRNPSIHKALLGVVFNHPSLWATGITAEGVRGPISVLDFMALTDVGNSDIGIHLKREAVDLAFEKLKVAIESMRPIIAKGREELDFTFVLEPMYDFLEGYKNELLQRDDFESVYDFVKSTYFKGRQYEELSKGISDSNKNAVVLALADLSSKVEHGSTDVYDIQVLLNKLLLQHEPGIEAGLNYLATWIVESKNKDFFLKFERTLKDIIEKYWVSDLIEGDIIFVKEMMVRIAWGMRQIGIDCISVGRWISYGRESPFNNLRQWLDMMDAKFERKIV